MLMVAIVGVRTFGLARPVLRYAERVVSHDAALTLLAERRARVYDALVPLVPGRLGPRRGDVLTSVVDDVDSLVDRQLRVRQPVEDRGLGGSLLATAFAALVTPVAGLVTALVCAVSAALGWTARPARRRGRRARLRPLPGHRVDPRRGDPAQRARSGPVAGRRTRPGRARRRRTRPGGGGAALRPRRGPRTRPAGAGRRCRDARDGVVRAARRRLPRHARVARHAADRTGRRRRAAPRRRRPRRPHGRRRAAACRTGRPSSRGERPRTAPLGGPRPAHRREPSRRGRLGRARRLPRPVRAPWNPGPGSAWSGPRAPASRRTPRC